MSSTEKTDPQMLADFLTGGTCLSYAMRDNGSLSVVAYNGKKFLFSPDQVAWAEKQLNPPQKQPKKQPENKSTPPPKPPRKPRAAKK